MLENLYNLLSKSENLSISGSGVEEIKVLNNTTVTLNASSIVIFGTGLNCEEEVIENDSFIIDLDELKDIEIDCDELVELRTWDDKIIFIEEY